MAGEEHTRWATHASGGIGTGLRRLLCVAGALLFLPGAVSAQEFLIHVNGDSINAEIKKFERGKLSYEIPGSSSASLEFQNVAAIGSPEDWDIELTPDQIGEINVPG